eukprot:TRINITY_DN28523_c0_g2_i1.p1 TRINITY_DN28523_c0_g2~~TRINITY_DN28523_c0_g2_i1.p1  ORF type:complete len:682 (-),score=102.32 TRINITY_DN28523_c0_g2_i1:20-2008(-)
MRDVYALGLQRPPPSSSTPCRQAFGSSLSCDLLSSSKRCAALLAAPVEDSHLNTTGRRPASLSSSAAQRVAGLRRPWISSTGSYDYGPIRSSSLVRDGGSSRALVSANSLPSAGTGTRLSSPLPSYAGSTIEATGLGRKRSQSPPPIKSVAASPIALAERQLENSVAAQLAVMEGQLNSLVSSAEAHGVESHCLRKRLAAVEDHRRACLEERLAAMQESERRGLELEELRRRLFTSEASLQSTEAALQEQRKVTSNLAVEKLEVKRSLSVQETNRRALAKSMMLAETCLMRSMSRGEGRQGSGVSGHSWLEPELRQDLEATLVKLREAASSTSVPLAVSCDSVGLAAGAATQASGGDKMAAAVEQLAAFAAHTLKQHAVCLQEQRCNAAKASSLPTLLTAGRCLSKSTAALLKRVHQLGGQLANGRSVRCARMGGRGSDSPGWPRSSLLWSGDFVPLNTELPAAEHAVAAWQMAAADVKMVKAPPARLPAPSPSRSGSGPRAKALDASLASSAHFGCSDGPSSPGTVGATFAAASQSQLEESAMRTSLADLRSDDVGSPQRFANRSPSPIPKHAGADDREDFARDSGGAVAALFEPSTDEAPQRHHHVQTGDGHDCGVCHLRRGTLSGRTLHLQDVGAGEMCHQTPLQLHVPQILLAPMLPS